MSADLDAPMVLRSVYLYVDQDERLRELAARRDTSKARLIRGYILDAMARGGAESIVEARPEKAPMVLRSIYFDQRDDEALRSLAFKHRMSKAELIRRCIVQGLQREVDLPGVQVEASGSPASIH